MDKQKEIIEVILNRFAMADSGVKVHIPYTSFPALIQELSRLFPEAKGYEQTVIPMLEYRDKPIQWLIRQYPKHNYAVEDLRLLDRLHEQAKVSFEAGKAASPTPKAELPEPRNPNVSPIDGHHYEGYDAWQEGTDAMKAYYQEAK